MFFDWFKKKNSNLGKVIHYFDKLQVAVVRLDGGLKVGDIIKITKHDHEFSMVVNSMQVNHQEVTVGKAGDEVAIKVSEPVKSGAVLVKA